MHNCAMNQRGRQKGNACRSLALKGKLRLSLPIPESYSQPTNRFEPIKEIHMAMIKVTSEDLANASAQLSSGSQEIDSHLTAMRNLVQSLVGSDWQGMASSSFEQLYAQWNTSAASLREALDGISA